MTAEEHIGKFVGSLVIELGKKNALIETLQEQLKAAQVLLDEKAQ